VVCEEAGVGKCDEGQCIVGYHTTTLQTCDVYDQVTSGICMDPLENFQLCQQVAVKFGYGDVVDDHQFHGSKHEPPFCYVDQGQAYFNAAGTNSGQCTTARPCFCRVVGHRKIEV